MFDGTRTSFHSLEQKPMCPILPALLDGRQQCAEHVGLLSALAACAGVYKNRDMHQAPMFSLGGLSPAWFLL